MKRLNAKQLLVLPSLVSAQEKVLNQENLQVRYGIYYEKRKRAPFTGKAFDQKYVNGQWKILNPPFAGKKLIHSEQSNLSLIYLFSFPFKVNFR